MLLRYFQAFFSVAGKDYLFLFSQQDTDMKFPGQFDKISWFLQPAGLEMLEKVSNSQPKPLSIGNFSTSLSEHLIFFQPTRFFSETGKVRNRFVGCPCFCGYSGFPL